MQGQSQRYVFIEFEDLKRIKFKKLERVCSRMFVLIDAEESDIPLSLIQQTQRLGKRLKWIPVHALQSDDMTHHVAFLMGRIHQKVEKEIEFAILSNDATLDPLVSFINNDGRNCLRVKRKRTRIEKEISESIKNLNQNIEEPIDNMPPAYTEPSVLNQEVEVASFEQKDTDTEQESVLVAMGENNEQNLIEKSARETVKRLIRSGNRPSELSMLKGYILLNNQEFTDELNIERIVKRLQETKEIQVDDQEVVYNF